jgi:biofilm PGA synthesis protein PgaA
MMSVYSSDVLEVRKPGNSHWSRRTMLPMLLIGFGLAAGVCAAQSSEMLISSEREAAVAQARAGDAQGALTILRRLLDQDPENRRLLADATIIAGWAGDDSYALELYKRPSTPRNDIDVVSAAAHSARNLHQYDEALDLYRQAAVLRPDRWQALLGQAMVLTDKGDTKQARALLSPILKDHADDLEVEAGEAYLCMREGDYTCVIRVDQRRSAQMPQASAGVQNEMALALARVGANGLAVENWHGADPQEGLRLKADLGAERVRWAEADRTWAERKMDASEAVALLEPVIAGTKPGDPLWKQAQADRLLALADLNRHADVVSSFERLQQQKAELPDYAVIRVADSYLAMRKPGRAEALYRNLEKRMQRDHDLWSGLAYSQFEQERIGPAYSTIDRAWSDAPQVLQAANLHVPQMNKWNTDFGLQAAEMRGYAGQFSQEQKRLVAMLEAAPANPDLHRALAMNYLDRGWPGRAARQEQIANSFEQPDELPVVADAQILEQGGRRDAADAMLRPLLTRDGTNAAMIRYLRDRAIARGWQGEVHGGFERSSGKFIGTNETSEAHLYSPLLDNRWRMYLHGWGDHGQFHAGETWRSRGALGMSFDYARQQLWAEAGADQNPAGAKLGVAAGADFSFGDHWTLGLTGDTDDLSQVQMIASLNDIHARSGNARLQWRASDLAEVGAGYGRQLFTDGNQRTIVSGTWDQRAWTTPHFQMILSPQVWTSWNSRDETRIYYNPKHDLSAGAAGTLRWVTWRRYERNFTQQLTVFGAPYWQQNYGTGYAVNSTYQQDWAFTRRFGAFGKVTWNSQPYDGKNEPYTDVTFGLSWGIR